MVRKDDVIVMFEEVVKKEGKIYCSLERKLNLGTDTTYCQIRDLRRNYELITN